MIRKLGTGLLLSALMMMAGSGVSRSQTAPEPAEMPDDQSGNELGTNGFDPEALYGLRQSRLGVSLSDVTSDKARDLKLPGEYGAIVESVEPASPAAKAGLEKGDVIVEFAGQRVLSEAQLRRMIRETPAGRTVSLEVIRNGHARSLSAKLQSGRNSFRIQVPEIQIPPIDLQQLYPGFAAERPSLGISGDELTPQLAGYFGVKQGKGVLVREVLVGSTAGKAGLKAGDVIVAVDGKSVATVANLRQSIDVGPSEEKRKVTLTIVRDHHEQAIPVEIKRLDPGEDGKALERFRTDLRELRNLKTQKMVQARIALQEAETEWGAQQQHRMMDDVRRATQEQQHAIDEARKALKNLAWQDKPI
jgi:predicted metalloprotease with PDZ domain